MRKDEFLARVQKAGGTTSRGEAERWSKAVLSALAELVDDAARRRHFISQLPGFLKSHLLAETPRSLSMNRDAFVRHVGAQLDVHAVEAERVPTSCMPFSRRWCRAGRPPISKHMSREGLRGSSGVSTTEGGRDGPQPGMRNAPT